jgi:hypothetical protein
MKKRIFLSTNRHGFMWFSVGILSVLGLITCIDIFISLKEVVYLICAVLFAISGSFCLWVGHIQSTARIHNQKKAERMGISVDADDAGFSYSNPSISIAERWSEIRFMGVYRVLHFGYSKIYFVVAGDSLDPLTIDCDLPSFGLLAERLYQHFPNLEWDWFYQFRLDSRQPESMVIFGNGESVAGWVGATR